MSRRSERRRQAYTLIDATLLNDMEQMREMLAQGVNANVRDAEHQETPLMLAKSDAAACLLLEHGADANAGSDKMRTPLMYARWPVLLEYGANVNAQDEDGETALMHTVRTGEVTQIDFLLTHGADATVRNAEGQTAEDIAREHGAVSIAEVLHTWNNNIC